MSRRGLGIQEPACASLRRPHTRHDQRVLRVDAFRSHGTELVISRLGPDDHYVGVCASAKPSPG